MKIVLAAKFFACFLIDSLWEVFMLHIGYHESSSQGFLGMGKEALKADADTFAFFTRNPRGGKAKEIDEDFLNDIKMFSVFCSEHSFFPLVAHAPYTMNPCSLDEGLREYAKNMMIDDLRRMKYVSGNFYNFHPGSHVQQGVEKGIELTAKMLSDVIKIGIEEKTLPGTTILIETMSGKGSEIGKTFEEVNSIILKTEEYLGFSSIPYLGVCMDSCHVWDGGYDIVHDLDGVICEFDKIIGLERLKSCHLNDSMNDLGSHKDRHQKIGQGFIGFEALSRWINHSAFKNIPVILETPNDAEGYADEIKRLKDSFRD